MKKILTISIIIPTYNNEKDLPLLLDSIKTQSYPKSRISVTVSDGYSNDNTRRIAKQYQCKIVDNPDRLADFGVYHGMLNSDTDVSIIMACDNRFHSDNYLELLSIPFMEIENLVISYPKQIYIDSDFWITKYTNTFTDPVNNFIYGYASNTRTFDKFYPVKYKTDIYTVYDFKNRDYPMLALAQGTMIRNMIERSRTSLGDDISPVKDWIDKGYTMAYVPQAEIEHHTIHSVRQYTKKIQWSFQNYLLGRSYGINRRKKYFSPSRKARTLFWPFYAGSLILPLLHAIFAYAISRRKEWLYHPLLTYIAFLISVNEYIRIKVLKTTLSVERNV